jgi:hypothetical protein
MLRPRFPQEPAWILRIAAAVNVANPIGQLGRGSSDTAILASVEPALPRPRPPHQFTCAHKLASKSHEGFPNPIAHTAAPDPFHWYTSSAAALFLRWAAG